MNIAVFTRSTVDHLVSGGMETQLQNLVEGLSEVGHDITVITTSHPYKAAPYIEVEDIELTRNGVKYYFIGNTSPGLLPLNYWEMIYSKLGFLKRGVKKEGQLNYYKESRKVFEKLDNKNNFDCIISQSSAAYGIFKYTDIPIVSVIHGSIRAEMKNRLKTNKTLFNWVRYTFVDMPTWIFELSTTDKAFCKRVDKVVAVSKAVFKLFIDEHPDLEKKVITIYNGVDSNLFEPDYTNRDVFRMLYVGRMQREKGVDTTIDALSKLVNRNLDIYLDLVGTGVHDAELKGITASKGLSSRVTFYGDVANEKLSDFYKRASVFLLPSRRVEGHPMTLSEAYCSGLPVISTSNGGLKELVFDGETGFIVKENDVKGIVDKIGYLYENRKVLERLSNNVRKIGVAKYSKKSMVEKYSEAILELVNSKNNEENT